jgi:hypothetical protein
VSRAPTRAGALAAALLGCALGCGSAARTAHDTSPPPPRSETGDVRAFALPELSMLLYLKPKEVSDHSADVTWLADEPGLGDVLELGRWVEGRCGFDVGERVHEILVTQHGDRWLAAIKTSLGQAESIACLEKLGEETEKKSIAGHTTYSAKTFSVVFVDDVLVVGPREIVEGRVGLAEDFGQRIPIWMPDFDETMTHSWVAVNTDGGLIDAVSFTLGREGANPRALSMSAHGVTVEDADWLASAFRDSLGREIESLPPAIREERREALRRDASVRRRIGARVELSAPLGQADDGRTAAALFEQLLRASGRRLRANAARDALWSLAGAMTAHALEHPLLGKPAFIGSAPLSPPAPFTHSTWTTLEFAAGADHEFAYEIVTAPNRRSAVLRARADLDDDGEDTIFELRLEVAADGHFTSSLESTGDEE